MPTILQAIKSFIFPEPKLTIPVEDVRTVIGYYERINRGAIRVDSEVVSSARECVLLINDHVRYGADPSAGRFQFSTH